MSFDPSVRCYRPTSRVAPDPIHPDIIGHLAVIQESKKVKFLRAVSWIPQRLSKGCTRKFRFRLGLGHAENYCGGLSGACISWVANEDTLQVSGADGLQTVQVIMCENSQI